MLSGRSMDASRTVDELAAHRVERLTDAGQRRTRGDGDRGIVEADQRDVLGNAPAGFLQHLQRARGHQVRRSEHRVEVRLAGEQLAHRLDPALLGEPPLGLEARIGLDAGCRQRLAKARHAIDRGRHVVRARDRRDAPPPEADQVAGRLVRTTPVVIVDIADGCADGWQPADDDRDAALAQPRRASGHHRGAST